MSTTWILIANASKAQLYETHKALLFKSNGHAEESLKLIKTLNHKASRKKSGDLVSDRVGNFQGRLQGHGSFVEASDPKDYEAEKFAKKIIDKLEQGRIKHAYDELIIVAAPYFRGILSKTLNGQLNKMIVSTILKDYTHLQGRQLANELRDRI